MAAGLGDEATRQAALEALPQVCRTGTHLFQFATFVEGFRGWGRSLRRAVGRWYAAQPVGRARLPGGQVPPARGRDAPRPAPPGAPGARGSSAGNPRLDVSDEHARLFEWIVRGGETGRPAAPGRGLRPRAGGGDAGGEAAALIREYRLPREALQTGAPDLAGGLGGAARRHADDGADPQPGDDDAGRRARAGLGRHGEGGRAARRRASASAGRACTRSRCSRRSARTRPAAVCAAAASGARCATIVDALDAAFYAAFGNVEPTGKRLLLALDVSGSMASARRRRAGPDAARRVGGAGAGDGRDASRDYEIVGFFAGERGCEAAVARASAGYGEHGLTPLAISPRQRLDDVVKTVVGPAVRRHRLRAADALRAGARSGRSTRS